MANSWTLSTISRECSSRSITTKTKCQIRTATAGGATFAIFANGSRTCSHEPASRSINGESVDNGDPLEAVADSPHPSLTRETEDAILALEYTPHEGLDIYSNGLYVTTKREYGVGGIVVSKRNLTLNFARNDIQSGCDRWQRIDHALEQARDDLYAEVSGRSADR